MSSKKRNRLAKKLHIWPSLVISIFIILWAISGIILNHRYTFSSYDINRNILPAEHQYRNWNNAAIKGSVPIDSNNVFFYGNVGIWQWNESNRDWKDFKDGFPSGADHYKVNCLYKTNNNQFFAGTRFGLYWYDENSSSWNAMEIPHHDKHVVDMLELQDSLLVMTRSHLWKTPLKGEFTFTHVSLPAPLGYDEKVGLFKTLWVIHSGEIYGMAGILLVDFVAFIFVFLTISGLIYFFFPGIMKKRKKKDKRISRLAFWNKWSITWHNKIGIWLVAILILTAFTGMFLRPPLLIAIASSRVDKIPYSVLDDGNPWYDQLRRILHDKQNNRFLLATSDGIFSADMSLQSAPRYMHPQPPVSVMGYNVFTKHKSGNILIGSFSGLYLWDTQHGYIHDMIAGSAYVPSSGRGNPISANMISGYHQDINGNEYIFDYNRGAMAFNPQNRFPEMPESISKSRMPLWNVALEMHTARLFKPLIGNFYILFIPLFGLSTLLILITGVILWIRKYKRARR